jgi:hypothetical protein
MKPQAKVLAVAVLVIVCAASAFALGRSTTRDTASEGSTETSGRDVTGRIGDVFRVPSVALFCAIDVEADGPRLLCNHTGDNPRYQVRMYRKKTEVGRIGRPGGAKVFRER